jgi:hypothetical protein
MQPHLEGDCDHLHLQNYYMLSFETCFMLLLYHLAAPHHIQPDMERVFWDSKIENIGHREHIH